MHWDCSRWTCWRWACSPRCAAVSTWSRAGAAALQPGGHPQRGGGRHEMLSAADSIGVFQVESRAQMTMLPRLKPRSFYDLVVEVAIVRPGPIQAAWSTLSRGTRPTRRRPAHRMAAAGGPCGARTYPGVPIFQEQVMQLAMVAAGFTLARQTSCVARWVHGAARANSSSISSNSSAACSSATTVHCLRNRSAARSRASAATAFRNRTPPALRCWCIFRPGSNASSRRHFCAACSTANRWVLRPRS